MADPTGHANITVTAESWDEARIAEAPGGRAVAQARFTTAYSGDVIGESTCGLLISYHGGDPADPQSLEGPFVGYEQVTGELAGRRGSFVLQASGEHSAGVARAHVTIVPGSGTGDLASISGSGEYAATGMEYALTLEWSLGN